MDVTMAEPGEILPDRKIDYTTYDKLQETKASVEEIVSTMLELKKEGKPKSELRKLTTQMFLNFVTLRQANRTILLQEDHVKSETERAKAPVDFTTLQLHNLMYEKNHYVKAIKACKDFKSKYPDIELVNEEEFFQNAPEEIQNSVISTDNAHNLMLKRLNFELFQRKELCKFRDQLEQKKKSLQEIITNRKKFLSSLPSNLKSLKKASLPLQNQLGILHTKKLKQQQLAELLPPPLFVLYSQLQAQKEAFGENIDLEIMGSIKDAQAFARQQANKETESSKLEDDIPDEEDDGQRRRKRPKKASLDQTGIYQAHPLKVTLHINNEDSKDQNPTKLITLKFEYLMKLSVVCVGIEGSQESPDENILCNLFPNDTGLELPNQSAKLCIGDNVSFDERRSSRPYKWAQHLAGIDFLPEVSPLMTGGDTSNHTQVLSGLSLYRHQHRVQTVVQRILSRKKAQLALAEQIDLIMKLKWPSVSNKSVPWALHEPKCSLHSCKLVIRSTNHGSNSNLTEGEQVSSTLSVVPLRQEVESNNNREDGELPGMNSVSEVTVTPLKDIDVEHSKRLSLISKSVTPLKMGKSPSLRKQEDDYDLILDSESEVDEPVKDEEAPEIGRFLWEEFGVEEYCLVLTRKLKNDGRNMKLEAKVKISKEYPIRPPLFILSLYSALGGESYSKVDLSEWYNELRAMESEVNVNIVESIDLDEEKWVLSHQVLCLAMLFDFYMDDGYVLSEKRKGNSVIDVGLCKPVSGGLISRSFRGRDRRKMISWKDNICTPGYPY